MAAAVVEQNYDEAGITWPSEIAPFQIHLIGLNLEIEEVRVALDEAIEEFEASIAGPRERMTDLQEAILEGLRQARNQVECGR